MPNVYQCTTPGCGYRSATTQGLTPKKGGCCGKRVWGCPKCSKGTLKVIGSSPATVVNSKVHRG